MVHLRRTGYWLLFVLIFLLGGCGGDDGGDFDNQGVAEISVSLSADKTTLSTNPNNLGPDPALPYTNTLTVRVQSADGRLVAGCIALAVTPSLANGALYYLDGDPEHEVKDQDGKPTGIPAAYRNLTFGCEGDSSTSGVVTAHFHAFDVPGVVTLIATATDPNTNRQVSATLQITVAGGTGPVSSLTFTGPFVNAVLANRVNFGTAADSILQNGTYSRVISVIANDPSGNPVAQRTPIYFSLIDAPLTGFPNLGAGSFAIAGNDGDPVEGGFLFAAANGNLIGKGARAGDRLVLDGARNPQADNEALTGVRVVESLLSQTELLIEQNGMPFAASVDNGPTVSYFVGRARHGTILTPMFTDVTGTATTFLNYPAARVGQTAVLVACTADEAICTVLNPCDAQGQNCGSVYLGVTDGTDVRLTASQTTLPPNTTSPVELCLKDRNFAPIQGGTLRYDIGAVGAATATIDGSAALSGAVLAGGNGCATVNVTTAGQIPGTPPIEITFSAANAQPVVVVVSGPGTGRLELAQQCDLEEFLAYRRALLRYQQCLATAEDPVACGAPPAPPLTVACAYNLRLVDDRGAPIPDIVVTYRVEGTVPVRIDFDPAFGEFGITDTEGRVSAEVEYQTGGETTITFQAGAAETTVTSPRLP